MEAHSVKVLLTKEHVILTKGSNSLWCSRDDGRLLPGKGRPQTTSSSSFEVYSGGVPLYDACTMH